VSLYEAKFFFAGLQQNCWTISKTPQGIGHQVLNTSPIWSIDLSTVSFYIKPCSVLQTIFFIIIR